MFRLEGLPLQNEAPGAERGCMWADTRFVIQIHKAKAEKQRERILKEEMQAKRDKNKAARERKQERLTAKRTAQLGGDEEGEKK